MAKRAGFGQKKPALAKEAGFLWPKAGFLRPKAGLRRLTPAYSILETLGSRLTPAYAGFHFPARRRSRLTPAYAGFFFPLGATGKEPAEAGVSRLPFWPKAGFSGQKEPAFGQERAGLRRLDILWAPRGRAGESRREPALFRPKEAGSSGRKSRLLSGQEEAGFGRLRRLTFRGAQRKVTSASTSPPPADKRPDSAPERCHIRRLFRRSRSFFGKHSYSAQRKRKSRQKPAFTVFPRVGKAGFCRLCQLRPEPGKRGPYYLRWCRTLPRTPKGRPRALFLTGSEGC